MQRMRRISPSKDTHTVQVEILIRDKEGQHEGHFTCDETSLLTCMHDPALFTELALQVDQLKTQLQKLTTAPLAKVRACYR